MLSTLPGQRSLLGAQRLDQALRRGLAERTLDAGVVDGLAGLGHGERDLLRRALAGRGAVRHLDRQGLEVRLLGGGNLVRAARGLLEGLDGGGVEPPDDTDLDAVGVRERADLGGGGGGGLRHCVSPSFGAWSRLLQ